MLYVFIYLSCCLKGRETDTQAWRNLPYTSSLPNFLYQPCQARPKLEVGNSFQVSPMGRQGQTT